MNGDIVHAVIYQVCADRGMQVHLERDLQLCADPVDARNQHRIRVLNSINGEQTSKATNFAQYSFSEGLVGEILDALLGAIGAADVHPGICIGDWRRTGRGVFGHSFFPFILQFAWDERPSAEGNYLRPLIVARSIRAFRPALPSPQFECTHFQFFRGRSRPFVTASRGD